MSRLIYILLTTIFISSLFVGCYDEKEHISAGTLEDILYDFHLSQNCVDQMDESYEKREFDKNVFLLEILDRHGVTKAEFDSSMIYFYRHADELKDIYESLSERMNKEVVELGGSATATGEFGEKEYGAFGDTANIWRYEKFMVLNNHKPYNHFAFEINADTSFRAKDKFILEFDQQMLFQEGMKRGTALLAIQYEKDSTSFSVQNFSIDGHTILTLTSVDSMKIKTVSGFIMINNGSNDNASSLKLLFLNKIRLLKIHDLTPVMPKEEKTEASKANTDALTRKDSAITKKDSVTEIKPMSHTPLQRIE